VLPRVFLSTSQMRSCFEFLDFKVRTGTQFMTLGPFRPSPSAQLMPAFPLISLMLGCATTCFSFSMTRISDFFPHFPSLQVARRLSPLSDEEKDCFCLGLLEKLSSQIPTSDAWLVTRIVRPYLQIHFHLESLRLSLLLA